MEFEGKIIWEGASARIVERGDTMRVFDFYQKCTDGFGNSYWELRNMQHINKFSLPKRYQWVCDLLEAMFPPPPESP